MYRAAFWRNVALVCSLAGGLALGACGGRSSLGVPPDARVTPAKDRPYISDFPYASEGPHRLDGPEGVDLPIKVDRSLPLDGPVWPVDWGWAPDYGSPDHWTPPPPDFGWLPDTWGPWCVSEIGNHCWSDADCCSSLSCMPLSTGAAVCTMACTPDDPYTPLVNEDSCPNANSDLVCATFSQGAGSGVCVRRCEPQVQAQTCPDGLACRPESMQFTTMADSPVCVFPACETGYDCPVRLDSTCNMTSSTPLCTQEPAGAFCAQEDPGSPLGFCALAGVCDPISGLCLAHNAGGNGQVGDPCQDDLDCGGQMTCWQEEITAVGMTARNGYCSIEGCAYADTFPDRACPSGSTCNRAYPGGFCFKSCDLEDSGSCRGHPDDAYGDYECYAWDGFITDNGQPVAATPTCEPVGTFGCDLFPAGVGCSFLGLPQNTTNMTCRNRQTGASLPAGSPNGFCLDDTSSDES